MDVVELCAVLAARGVSESFGVVAVKDVALLETDALLLLLPRVPDAVDALALPLRAGMLVRVRFRTEVLLLAAVADLAGAWAWGAVAKGALSPNGAAALFGAGAICS